MEMEDQIQKQQVEEEKLMENMKKQEKANMQFAIWMHNNGYDHYETFDRLTIQKIRNLKEAKYDVRRNTEAKQSPEP